MRNFLVCCLGILISVGSGLAQAPKKLTSSEVYHSLQKLNFLGSALYIAAHPDDENTRLISYFSNEVKARTAYLSITRGDGGQNLIGPELRELLGVLRTQELLAARRVDGGEQFFTRANDFGYSKHPKETLKLWNKDEVLGDVVWVIRNFKPDVIVNRFDHRTPGSTHGHHTSSAILSEEAFDLANDKSAYTDQLELTNTWQPRRLFFNTSWWFYGSPENFEKADKSQMLNVDIGVYYPMLGLSNNEIASIASSQHLCQGFGRITTRGSQQEYIELLKGDLPENKSNVFDGINTSWSRIPGGEAVGKILYDVEKNFDFNDPASHLSQLAEAYTLLDGLDDQHWKRIKIQELKSLILAVSGLYLEASATDPVANPGSEVQVKIEALNRSKANITLNAVTIDQSKQTEPHALDNNKRVNFDMAFNVPTSTEYTSPYWLAEEGTLGMYKVDDRKLIGKPETPRAFHAVFELQIDKHTIAFSRPVTHRYSKPDKGELYKPFEVLPEVTAKFADDVVIFADGISKVIPVTIRAHANNVSGVLKLNFGSGWQSDQDAYSFEIEKKGDEKTINLKITPPPNENQSQLSAIMEVNGKTFAHDLVEITYDHIPTQSILLPATVKVVRLDIQKAGEHIGYIVGAGDKVPESLRQIGYTVHTIDPATIQIESLKKYDAVVVGIRAYNVVEELKFKQPTLLDYVKEGGNLIIQYNTAGRRDFPITNLAPYPMKLSRDRVTEESAAVDIIAKNHALVNFPNQIAEGDFDNWVQERGLYFPNEWDEAFTPILSMHDEGETPKQGSLLVAPYGEGNYIYTGLSFFRELPAGVPGAYKLFANMLSLGKEKVENESNIKG